MCTTGLPLAVSLGDPSGIGPDVLLRAWAERVQNPLPPFFVAGDIELLRRRAVQLDIACDLEIYEPGDVIVDAISVFDTGFSCRGEPGKPDSDDAKATIAAIRKCVELTMDGKAGGVVTCPINKAVLYSAGFSHPGHTEFLGDLAKEITGKAHQPVMMLAGPELRTVPVTIHIALHDVPQSLTQDMIVETGTITARDLTSRFGIESPRLAVSGLNPHAGENGSMGKQDQNIIAPAISVLRANGIDAVGPMPADTMFHEAARKSYDVAICMYHDQALIPAKTLAFDEAVNVTLGLPFIRTSPDHGTAYDIAGTGKANPSSFVAALRMAHEMGQSA